jgi:hypothetical protein
VSDIARLDATDNRFAVIESSMEKKNPMNSLVVVFGEQRY